MFPLTYFWKYKKPTCGTWTPGTAAGGGGGGIVCGAGNCGIGIPAAIWKGGGGGTAYITPSGNCGGGAIMDTEATGVGSEVEVANTGGGPRGWAWRICGETTRCGEGTLGPAGTVGLPKPTVETEMNET